jgi:hypothetical protein
VGPGKSINLCVNEKGRFLLRRSGILSWNVVDLLQIVLWVAPYYMQEIACKAVNWSFINSLEGGV